MLLDFNDTILEELFCLYRRLLRKRETVLIDVCLLKCGLDDRIILALVPGNERNTPVNKYSTNGRRSGINIK